MGFEPTIPVKVCPLSRRIVSTTHAPLRWDEQTKDVKERRYKNCNETRQVRFAGREVRHVSVSVSGLVFIVNVSLHCICNFAVGLAALSKEFLQHIGRSSG